MQTFERERVLKLTRSARRLSASKNVELWEPTNRTISVLPTLASHVRRLPLLRVSLLLLERYDVGAMFLGVMRRDMFGNIWGRGKVFGLARLLARPNKPRNSG